MYALLDSKETVPHPDITEMLEALENGDLKGLGASAQNSFSAVWGEKTQNIKSELKSMGALGAELSGSGPSVFGIFNSGEGEKVYEKLKNQYKEVYLCTPKEKGVE